MEFVREFLLETRELFTEIVSAGAGLEDVGTLVIVSSHQQTNTVGSLPVPLGTDLHLVPEVLD